MRASASFGALVAMASSVSALAVGFCVSDVVGELGSVASGREEEEEHVPSGRNYQRLCVMESRRILVTL